MHLAVVYSFVHVINAQDYVAFTDLRNESYLRLRADMLERKWSLTAKSRSEYTYQLQNYQIFSKNYRYLRSFTIASETQSANAISVSIGFTPVAVGSKLASATHTPS